LLRLTTVALAAICLCSADTLTLRSGRIVTGHYLGGDARHIRMAIGDHVDTFDVEDVGNLQFGGDAPSGPPPVTGVQIPAGTPITVRMIDSVDSNVAHQEQAFRASVDEAVLLGGQTVIPRGADALVKLVEDQPSGKFEGKTILTLALMGITLNGQTIDTTAGDVSKASGSRGARSAKVVGGGAALGAIIGALAGGGKGAAIGAGAGGAVGTGVMLSTSGKATKLPVETRLTFRLNEPVSITEQIRH
jgi:hypothetical protein